MNAKEVVDVIVSYIVVVATVFGLLFLYSILIDALSDEWLAVILTALTSGVLLYYAETRRNK